MKSCGRVQAVVDLHEREHLRGTEKQRIITFFIERAIEILKPWDGNRFGYRQEHQQPLYRLRLVSSHSVLLLQIAFQLQYTGYPPREHASWPSHHGIGQPLGIFVACNLHELVYHREEAYAYLAAEANIE